MAYQGSIAQNIPSYKMEVILDGDWARAQFALAELGPAIAEGSHAGQISAAKKLEAVVKKNLRSNGSSLGWQGLAPSTQAKKAKMGYDPSRILYATGTYLRSIVIREARNTVSVGVKPKTQHPTSPLTVNQIAIIHEYGSNARNIPARPLWGPSWKQFGGGLRVKQLMSYHIKRAIRAIGF